MPARATLSPVNLCQVEIKENGCVRIRFSLTTNTKSGLVAGCSLAVALFVIVLQISRLAAEADNHYFNFSAAVRANSSHISLNSSPLWPRTHTQ